MEWPFRSQIAIPEDWSVRKACLSDAKRRIKLTSQAALVIYAAGDGVGSLPGPNFRVV